jgi:hypothetical protein
VAILNIGIVMAKKPAENELPLLAHLPRLEADGSTHRRDCECVRCDAGYRPTEEQRESARLRFEVQRARAAAERALARRRERERVKKTAVALELGAAANDVDERIRALRAARARAEGDDGRLALLRRLREAGLPLGQALAAVDRAENENGVGPAGFEPAAYGLKVRSSTS